MATFKVTTPDGKSFKVTAPDAQSAHDAVLKMAAPQAQPEQPQNGNLLDSAINGLTFGLGDEAAGAIGGVADWLGLGPEGSKGTFSGGYDRVTGNIRSDLAAVQQRHPIAAPIAEIGGALATLPVTGGINLIRAPAAAGKVAQAAAAIGNSAITGAAYGGVSGFGNSEGGVGNRIAGAASGAALGGAIGAAAPALGYGAKAAFRAVVPAGLVDARGAASKLVGSAVKADARVQGKSLDQLANEFTAARTAGVPVTPMDIGEGTRGLARAAADVSPEGRSVLNSVIDPRFETQINRIEDTISKVAPGINSPATSDMLQQAARTANKAAYGKAYIQGANGIMTPGLEKLTTAPEVVAAIKAGARTVKNKMASDMSPGPLMANKGPTLEYWDQVKRELDSVYSVAQRAGDKEKAATVDALRKKLVSELDAAVPSYRAARQGAAAFFGADNALEAGQKFVKMSGDVTKNADMRAAIAKMTPAERSLFGEGFATQLIGDLRGQRDRISLVNKIFASPEARARFELALGPSGAREMEATLRVEGMLDKAREVVQGNSKTARYLTEIAKSAAPGAAGLGVGLYSTGGNFADPKTYIYAALAAGASRVRSRGTAWVQEKVMREVADMLASGDPQQFRNAIQRIGRNPALLQSLRRGQDIISRGAAPIAGQGVRGALPMTADTGSQPAQAQSGQ